MLSLSVFALAVAAGALIGSRFKPDAWYRTLRKPSWNPPDWVFAPVWTLLYVGIAVAGWLVWRDSGRVEAPLVLWGIQIVLNTVWTWLYFGRHNIAAAFVDSALLLVVILAFIAQVSDINVVASILFVPYALWVAFATFLNGTIWRMNRTTSADVAACERG